VIETPGAAAVRALAMLALAAVVGLGVLRTARVRIATRAEHGLVALGLGFGVISHVWFLLGTVRGYRASVAWALCVAGFVAATGLIMVFVRRPRIHGASEPLTRDEGGLIVLLGAAALVVLACGFVPPVALDTLQYHANVAALFARAGRIVFEPITPYAYPLGGEMFYLWSLLLGGALAGKVVNALHGVMAIAAIVTLGARHGGRTVGLLAALIFATTAMTWHFAFDGKTDLVLVMHTALALLCYDAFRRDRARGAIALCAAFAGFAASAKVPGLFVVAALAAVLARDHARELPRYAAVAAVVGAPWYARNWLYTGDPLWPALYAVLGGDAAARIASRDLFDHTTFERLFGWHPAGWAVGAVALIGGWPPLYGRTLLGPLFVLGLVVVPWRREARSSAWLAGFVAVLYTGWFAITRVGRHAAVAFVALAVLAARGLAAGAATGSRARVCIRVSVAGWALVSMGLAATQLAPFAALAVGRDRIDDVLDRFTSHHAVIRWMNANLPRDAVIASDWSALFYLERGSVWLSDLQGFVDPDERDAAVIHRTLRVWGVTHLFLTGTAADGMVETVRRCGTVVRDDPGSPRMTSVTLRERMPVGAAVYALADRCGPA
jgi:hypothetical protein